MLTVNDWAEGLTTVEQSPKTMATDRKFTRFSRTDRPLQIREVPEGGMCLSAFLVISRKGRPNEVLMGRLRPDAPWDHIGAQDSARAEANSKGWMLPSSHLILGEGPGEAARRIAQEQLGLRDPPVHGPLAFSEVYGSSNHWDLEFIFTGELDTLPVHDAWKELRFVDLNRTRKEDFARSHEDILAHIGRWKPA